MTRRLRTAFLALTCLSALALTGCGSSFSCDGESACSADAKPTDASIAACNTEVDGKCGTEFKAVGQCTLDNQKCTADNTTDPSSISGCATQIAAYATCKQNNP